MNNALRIMYGAAHAVTGSTPYRPAHEPRNPANPAHPVAGAQALPHGLNNDTYAATHPQAHASLRHSRSSLLPLDIGIPELDQADADNFAAPPLDLDELAACAGQSRVFGPAIGRAIMAVGSYFAVYATYAAVVALIEDSGTLLGLTEARTRLDSMRPTRAIRGLGRVFAQEIKERKQAWNANWVLLPGSLGMAVNLLGSAELFGHFIPSLVPVAVAAMGPAAICMTVYGAFIAYKAVNDVAKSRRQAARMGSAQPDPTVPTAMWQEALRAIAGREAIKRRFDVALGISGGLQAAGALLQWLLGPIYLLLLLPAQWGSSPSRWHGPIDWAPTPWRQA